MTVENVDLGKKGHFSLHKGALHRALGVPEGQPIPAGKKSAALNSSNPHVRHMAASARGLAGMTHHSAGGNCKVTANKRQYGGRVFDRDVDGD